jgi:predicted glycosyltransferase
MQKILFYCQNFIGMGHLVRTTEIMRVLVKNFQVCLIEGGQRVEDFELPHEVEVIHLPALQKELSETFQISNHVQTIDGPLSLDDVKAARQETILNVFEQFKPDCLITEGYPFSKHDSLSFEMIPLLERVKQSQRSTKVICSLRDIIMVKELDDRAAEEQRRCQFTNHYYDALLVHSDPQIHRLDDNISRANELTCPVYYTGYVAQSEPEQTEISAEDAAILANPDPMILVSVGGGKLGHDLLKCVIDAASLIELFLPHHLHIFAGPLMPAEKYQFFKTLAHGKPNLTLRQYTPHLLAYMEKADLSISLGGYNTTMNVLATGVRSMIYPSTKDREQAIRAEKLERLGLLQIIHPDDLFPERITQKIVTYLKQDRQPDVGQRLALQGAEKTAEILQNLLNPDYSPASTSNLEVIVA